MEEITGIDNTWKEFSQLIPSEVSQQPGVSWDNERRIYTVSSFGQDVFISMDRKKVFSLSPEGTYLVGIKDYFFDLSVLWYLIGAQDIPLSGNLIKPSDVPGGQIFVQGTHVLPVDQIARKYNGRKARFYQVAQRFGGVPVEHGDAAVKLLPFPRVPVFLILWFGDEDFSPSGQLLLDSTCSSHLSTDVLWALTMVCCVLFLDA
ncbi:DUF3786 domain-containing protein [Thermodesulfobacteriota bacterium]